MPVSVLDAHLDRCESCRVFAARAEAANRRLRVRPAEAVPDLTGRIMAALAPGSRLAPPETASWRRRRGLGVAAAVAVAAVVIGAFVGASTLTSGHSSSPSGVASVRQVAGSTQSSGRYPGAIVLPIGVAKPDVTLTDTEGRPYNLTDQTSHQVTLVYFGYTHCPDVCPINMALAAQALRLMTTSQRRDVTVVFVTTDGARDTPPVMRAWLDQFDSRFIGLTGSETQIHQAEQQIGMPLSYAETAFAPQAGGYQVVHAGYTLVYSQDGVAHLQVDATESPSAYASTLVHLLAHGYQSS